MSVLEGTLVASRGGSAVEEGLASANFKGLATLVFPLGLIAIFAVRAISTASLAGFTTASRGRLTRKNTRPEGRGPLSPFAALETVVARSSSIRAVTAAVSKGAEIRSGKAELLFIVAFAEPVLARAVAVFLDSLQARVARRERRGEASLALAAVSFREFVAFSHRRAALLILSAVQAEVASVPAGFAVAARFRGGQAKLVGAVGLGVVVDRDLRGRGAKHLLASADWPLERLAVQVLPVGDRSKVSITAAVSAAFLADAATVAWVRRRDRVRSRGRAAASAHSVGSRAVRPA